MAFGFIFFFFVSGRLPHVSVGHVIPPKLLRSVQPTEPIEFKLGAVKDETAGIVIAPLLNEVHIPEAVGNVGSGTVRPTPAMDIDRAGRAL